MRKAEKERETVKMAKGLAEEYYGHLMKAIDLNLFPAKHHEGVFGIRMDAGPTVTMGHPFEGGKKEKWLGNIVFGSWITLHMNGQLKKEPFVEALMAGRLPQWFEEQIRNDPKMSYYAKALVDGDLFGQIQWDREKLKLFDPKSRLVCLDAQFKYRSNTQTNAS